MRNDFCFHKVEQYSYPAPAGPGPRLLLWLVLIAMLLLSTDALSEDPPNVDDMVRSSDFVFEGRVIRIDYRFTSPAAEGQNQLFPYTFVTYQIDSIYKGNTRNNTVTLRFAGGPSENVGEFMLPADSPLFDADDRDILFVNGNELSPCPLVDCAGGRLRLIDDMVVNDAGQPVTVNENGEMQFDAPLDFEEVNTHNLNDVMTLQRQEHDEQGNPIHPVDPGTVARDGLMNPADFGVLLQERVRDVHSDEELAALPEFLGADPDQPLNEAIWGALNRSASLNKGAGPTGDLDADIDQQVEHPNRTQWTAQSAIPVYTKDIQAESSPLRDTDTGNREKNTADYFNNFWWLFSVMTLTCILYLAVRRYLR